MDSEVGTIDTSAMNKKVSIQPVTVTIFTKHLIIKNATPHPSPLLCDLATLYCMLQAMRKLRTENEYNDILNKLLPLLHYVGLYSETGFYYGIERNFVCSWRRPNCKSQVIDLSLSALIS
jgi:hypothetical protein